MATHIRIECINHPGVRAKARGLCHACYNRNLYHENPQYRANQDRRVVDWHRNNREQSRENNRRRYERTPAEKKRDRNLRKKYGITIVQYEEMLSSQHGLCAICEKPPAEGKLLHVDHCHKTNVVRGLLCNQCNWYLGKIDNDDDLIGRLLDYLKRSHETISARG